MIDWSFILPPETQKRVSIRCLFGLHKWKPHYAVMELYLIRREYRCARCTATSEYANTKSEYLVQTTAARELATQRRAEAVAGQGERQKNAYLNALQAGSNVAGVAGNSPGIGCNCQGCILSRAYNPQSWGWL